MQGELAGKVEKVTVSKRLTDTPCILVTSKFGWSANMERIMKAQAMGDNRAQEYMKGKKMMEINPKSPVILDLKAKLAAGETAGFQRHRRTPLRRRCSIPGSPSTSPRRSRRRSSTSWARLVGGASGDAFPEMPHPPADRTPEAKEETKEEEAKPDAIDPEVVCVSGSGGDRRSVVR